MNTPICDFVRRYVQENTTRLHMPGHKGAPLVGFEPIDLTEIDGADSLFEASGIPYSQLIDKLLELAMENPK